MQPSSSSTVSAAHFRAPSAVSEDPALAKLRSALEGALYYESDDVDEVYTSLLSILGGTGTAKGVTASGRSVAKVLSLDSIQTPYLACFDKLVWCALADVAARRGFVLPPEATLPSGVQIRGISGRPYFRDHRDLVSRGNGLFGIATSLADRQVNSVNFHLNGTAHFTDSKAPIVCRHLALNWIARRQAHHTGHRLSDGETKAAETKSSRRFTNFAVSSVQGIQDNVPASTEAAFQGIAADRSKSAAIVYLSQLSDFLKQEYSSMAPGQNRHFCLVSTNHAMAVELRCKEDEVSGRSYVLNFYDPNRTVTSRRMVFKSPEDVSVAAQHLIPAEAWVSGYFGATEKDRVGLFIRMTDPADAPGAKPPQPVLAVHRPTGDPAACAPEEVWLRARYGLAQGVDAFMESRVLSASSNHKANYARLDGRSTGDGRDESACLTAIMFRNFDIAKSMVEAAQAAVGDGRLTGNELVDFLRPIRADGRAAYSTLAVAMSADSVESLGLTASLINALVVASKSGALSEGDVTDLLPAAGRPWKAWANAVKDGGCDAAITKNLWALVQASQAGLLTLDQLLPMDDIPGHFVVLLQRAEASSDFELARGVWAICAQALVTGLLDEEGFDTLLQPIPGPDGKFNQMGALMQAGAPADLLAAPVWAVMHSRLEASQKVDLLAKLFPRPQWFPASSRRQERSQAVWVDAVRKASLDALPQAHRGALRERLGLEFDLTPFTRAAVDPVTTQPASS